MKTWKTQTNIDPELLDTISLAGKCFEEILNRLKGR